MLTGPRYGPRPVDLDIIFYDGTTMHLSNPDLHIPHCAWHERAFVTAPLADLADCCLGDFRGEDIRGEDVGGEDVREDVREGIREDMEQVVGKSGKNVREDMEQDAGKQGQLGDRQQDVAPCLTALHKDLAGAQHIWNTQHAGWKQQGGGGICFFTHTFQSPYHVVVVVTVLLLHLLVVTPHSSPFFQARRHPLNCSE